MKRPRLRPQIVLELYPCLADVHNASREDLQFWSDHLRPPRCPREREIWMYLTYLLNLKTPVPVMIEQPFEPPRRKKRRTPHK
jgi:hypothetical protein